MCKPSENAIKAKRGVWFAALESSRNTMNYQLLYALNPDVSGTHASTIVFSISSMLHANCDDRCPMCTYRLQYGSHRNSYLSLWVWPLALCSSRWVAVPVPIGACALYWTLSLRTGLTMALFTAAWVSIVPILPPAGHYSK